MTEVNKRIMSFDAIKRKEVSEILLLLNEALELEQDVPLHTCSNQRFLDIICNRNSPFTFITLGQDPDKSIENGLTLGPSSLEHYIQVGEHRVYGRQLVSELVNLLKALLETHGKL